MEEEKNLWAKLWDLALGIAEKRYVSAVLFFLPALLLLTEGLLRRNAMVPFYGNYYYCSAQPLQNNFGMIGKISRLSVSFGSYVGWANIIIAVIAVILLNYAVYLFLGNNLAPIRLKKRNSRMMIASLSVLGAVLMPSIAMSLFNAFYCLLTLSFLAAAILSIRARRTAVRGVTIALCTIIIALLFGIEPAAMIFPFLIALTFAKGFINERKRRLQYVLTAFLTVTAVEILLSFLLRTPYILIRPSAAEFINSIFYFGSRSHGLPFIAFLLLGVGFAYISRDFRKYAFSFSFGFFFLLEYVLFPHFSFSLLALPISVLLAYSIQAASGREWELRLARRYLASAIILGLIILNIYFLSQIGSYYPLHKEGINGTVLALGSIYPYFACNFNTYPKSIGMQTAPDFALIRNLTMNSNPDHMAYFFLQHNITTIVLSRSEVSSYLGSDDSGILAALRTSPQISRIHPKNANPSLEYYNFTS